MSTKRWLIEDGLSTQIPINTIMLNGKAQRFHRGVGRILAMRTKHKLTDDPNIKLATTSDNV
jgi:hypothetical protein